MRHTPGPWRADASHVRFSVNTDTLHIAMVNIMGMPINEARANALLISSAPEMLEALEMVGPFLARYDYLEPNGDELIIKVADAIAKAKGESNE